MIKWIPIIFLLNLAPSKLLAQKQGQEKIDSMVSILKSKTDTAQINLLNLIAYEFRNINPDTSIYYANQALDHSIKLKFQIGIANAKLAMARAKANLGSTDIAIKCCIEALTIFNKLLPSAPEKLIPVIKSQISGAYNMMGIAYMMKGNNPEALKFLYKALKIRTASNDELGISYTENNLGIIYLNQNNYQESLKHFSISLKIRLKLDDKSGASNSYNNIGVIYFNLGKFQEAHMNYLKSLELANEIGDDDAAATASDNIGSIYEKQGNFAEALKHYYIGLTINKKVKNKSNMAASYGNIAGIYIQRKQYKTAKYYIDSSLTIAKEIEAIDQLKYNYKSLTTLDSSQNNFRQAFENYKLHIQFRDSIINEGNIKKITEQEMQYDFDKKEAIAQGKQEKKDVIANEELKKQKLVRNGFVGGFTIVLLFAGIFLKQRNKIKKGKKLSDGLLLNILPEEVAEELKQKGSADARQFDEVTVMFTDFKGFTQISEKLTPKELVAEIHTCFKAFDDIISKHNIEKIKTIGDSYMCAGGLPVPNKTNALEVVNAALEIQQFMQWHLEKRKSEGKEIFEIRIGIHTGPVVAGIVGVKKFAYDIWGDTVNIASRMESSGEPGKINISGSTYEIIKNQFNCEHRGKIEAKNKGGIDMYFVSEM
ncbi:MAG: tetratricopeptide repeat protein [Bacteroidetes bacterium]|nr:tetratricopeptide repeat protein [Bacteroidota bacterium]